MARRVGATPDHIRFFAQTMLAEGVGEGRVGMHMIGTVTMNRIYANCHDFEGIRNILQAIKGRRLADWSSPYEAVQNGLVYKMRPKQSDLNLAQQLANGRISPRARIALWYQNPTPPVRRTACPPRMPRAPLTRYLTEYKNHCFYTGAREYECPGFTY